MLRADGYVGGNDYHLYSASTQEDVGRTVNITPFTDLIVANVAGTIAQKYFDDSKFSSLTKDQLNTESDALRAKLLPTLQALGVSDTIDLLRATFAADHKGLDAALDVLRVTIDPATQIATIKNIITQEQITADIAQKKYSGDMNQTAGVADGATAIQIMDSQLKKFSDLFATSLPSATDVRLLALFDEATYLDGGEGLAAFLSQITTEPACVGIKFSNMTLKSMNATQDRAIVTFTVIENGRESSNGPVDFYAIKKNGAWLFQGNQRLVSVGVNARSEYVPSNPSASQFFTGLTIGIRDRGNKGIDSAVVTGPGITGSVTLVKVISEPQFRIGTNGGNFYTMTDAVIDTIPADTPLTYTFKVYSGTTLKDTYTQKLKKRPYKLSELTAATFPAITAQTKTAWSAFQGGSVNIAWTIPSGLSTRGLETMLGDNAGNRARIDYYDLKPTDTSKTVILAAKTATGQVFTPTWRRLYLSAQDSFGRVLALATN